MKNVLSYLYKSKVFQYFIKIMRKKQNYIQIEQNVKQNFCDNFKQNLITKPVAPELMCSQFKCQQKRL